MRIDPQRLIRLAVLIQHGSFSRAAAYLGLTQPALSQSIAQIEKEVGVKLIERTPHGVEPTLYGQVLYEHAKSIDRELALAAQHIGELAFGHKGALRIGATVGGAASFVALAVCKLQAARAGIDTRIVEEFTIDALLAQLHDRTLDVLVCPRPRELDLKGTNATPLFLAKRLACVRSGHPLSGDVSLRELSTFPFVCPQEELGLLFGFRQIFATIGVDLPEVLVVNSVYLAKELVLNSDAFGLFSDVSILNEQRLGLVKPIELETPTQYWMQLILRAGQAPAEPVAGFVAELLRACIERGIEVHPGATPFPQSHPELVEGQPISRPSDV
jgi:DNA-binding transcriptional LysR family regulator